MTSDALAAWSPALSVFTRRCLAVGLMTLLLVACLGWVVGAFTGLWHALFVGPVLALAYNIGFEDPARWRAARANRWYLRSDALIHHGPDGETRIPLADIMDARSRLGWSVVIFLKGGLRVRMAYVAEPAAKAAQILAARDRLSP